MKTLAAYARGIDWLNEKIGVGVSWVTTLLVAVVCYDVFTRYVLDESRVWVQELEWHLFSVIFLLGAAYTLKHDKHVRVDLLYMRLGDKGKAWVNLLGTLFFLLPFCVLVIWMSLPYVEYSWSDGEGSPNPGGLPARYILKACLPLAFALLLLQGLAFAIRSFRTLRGIED